MISNPRYKSALGSTVGNLIDPTETIDLPAGMSAQTRAAAKAGMCVRLDPTTKLFEIGVGNDHVLPYWLHTSPLDGTVSNVQGDPANDPVSLVSTIPGPGATGVLRGIPHTVSADLWTTEFDTGGGARTALNTPNTRLGSPKTGPNAGKLVVWASGMTTVGYVTQGVVEHPQDESILTLVFRPVFLPPAA